MPSQRTYIAIDLKSFYASVECVERGLDPLTTNLVVADASRTDKTICLAVSPSLKAYGIPGRPRLFEAKQKVAEVNAKRRAVLPMRRFVGRSAYDAELKAHPDWEVDFIVAPPRMAYYIDYSTRIYNVYLKYVSHDDIFVYSIDEVFMDVTDYLATYKMTAHQLAITMIRDVLKTTGITATAGIGTNMYLCKVAMDIVAKHVPPDADGVRIAELDERTYREHLWHHRPLTAFWRVGRGIAQRLEANGIYTMGQLARCSINNEEMPYKMFGVNAELLIDHAWGWEPCTMKDVKAYRPRAKSLSSGQVLQCGYTFEKARIVVREMADAIAIDLVSKCLATDSVVLSIAYDVESLKDPTVAAQYHGGIAMDYYGRRAPMPAHGSVSLKAYTSSSRVICEAVLAIYDKQVNPLLLVRRINIAVGRLQHESIIQLQRRQPEQLDLFTDYDALAEQRKKEAEELDKEHRMQQAMLAIKHKYGKNAILRGTNFEEGATAKDRNNQIGGHKA